MKIKSITTLAWLFYLSSFSAQGLVAVGGFRNSDLVIQDSIISFATLGYPMGGTTSQNGLFVTTDLFPFLLSPDTTTSTKHIEPITGIQIFPNPTPDILVIQREDVELDLFIEIFNMNGALQHHSLWPRGVGTFQPSLQSYAPGTYFISVMNQDKTKGNQYKIVKQ